MNDDIWLKCVKCPPDDNMWLRSAFTAAGSAFSPTHPVCNACIEDRYERIRGDCVVCGGRAETKRKRGSERRPLKHRGCEIPTLTFEYLEAA